LRGVDETAWFARDDLRPFGLICLRMGWRLAKSPLARARRHARTSGFRHRVGRAASGPEELLIA
jgi:D-aspartate ligase